MGHTVPPFTWQFQKEKIYFRTFRRALLLAEDKSVFDDLWNTAEFHITAAEKTSHPLPGITIMMMMNLEQQKTIRQLEHKIHTQAETIKQMERALRNSETQLTYLKHEVATIEENIESLLQAFRNEMLALKYPEYEFAA
jgi:hypothetical protein